MPEFVLIDWVARKLITIISVTAGFNPFVFTVIVVLMEKHLSACYNKYLQTERQYLATDNKSLIYRSALY